MLSSLLRIIFLVALLHITPAFAQQTPVLWTNSWNVDFMLPQRTGFSSDSRYFAMGYDGGNIAVFEAATGDIYRMYHLHSRHVFCTIFEPNGNILASGDKEGFLVLYDFEGEREIRTIKAHDKTITGISFSNDGKLLVTGSKDKTIKIWDPATGYLLSTIDNVAGKIVQLRVSNDNKKIIAGTTSPSNGLRIYDIKSGAEIMKFESPNVQGVDITADNKFMATANLRKDVMIYDLKQYKLLNLLEAHTKVLTDVVFSPSGKVLYSSSKDRSVAVWDVANLKLLDIIYSASKKIASISISPDGKYLAVLDENFTFSILDISNVEKNLR